MEGRNLADSLSAGPGPHGHASLYLAAGERSWLAEPEPGGVSVVLGEATRQRFADAAMNAINAIPSGDRRFG